MLPFNNPHGMPRFMGRPGMPYGNPLMMHPMNVMVGAPPGLPRTFMPPQPPMHGGMGMGPFPAMPGLPPSMQPHYQPLPQRPMLIGPGVVTSSIDRLSQESPSDNGRSTTSPAADDWTEHTSADGRRYYYNRAKKVSSWTKPDCLKTSQEKEKGVWREYKTAEGRPYYYNTTTKQTTWSRPGALGGAAGADDGGAAERGGGSQHDRGADSSELERAMAATMKKLEAEASTTQVGRHDASVPGADGKPSAESQEQDAKQRQVDRFRELLKDKYTDGRITTAMSWEQACRLIQHDQRFKALPKISEKKQTFNAWKIQRAKEEKDEKRLAIKKAKDDLEKWLMANPKMTTTMTYGKATSVFEQDMFWKGVNEIERREIFRDVQSALKKKQDTAAVVLRERNKKALADILDSIEEVNHRTTWAQAQRILIENESFAMDSTLQGMDKEDALIIFQQHIRTAEKQYDEERVLDTKRNRRQERKIREAFVNFLKELHTRGTINSVSTWSSLYPIVSSDERFEAMLAQPGSTALDLFKFQVEELKNQYYEDRKRIREILKEKGFEVAATTRLDQMQEWVVKSEKGRDVDAGNLKLCWTSLVDKAQAKEKELEREQTRKLKRQEAAFHSLIRNAQPPVEPTSKWEAVRESISHMDGFEAVESEEKRLEFFSSYIKAISEACGHHHGSTSTRRKKKDKKRRKKEMDDGRDERDNAEPSQKKSKRAEGREGDGKESGPATDSSSAVNKHKKTKRHQDDEGVDGNARKKHKKHRRPEDGELEEGEAEDD